MEGPVADSDDSNVDTSDLKARLGLKRRARAQEEEVAAAPAEPAVAAEPAPPAGPSADEVADARRRAEEAMAEAGTAVEDFGLMGAERTPAPQTGGPQYITVEGSEGFAGQNKGKLIPMVAGGILLFVVAYGVGNVMGSQSKQNEIVDMTVGGAADQLKFFEETMTADGVKVLEAIEQMKADLNAAEKAISEIKNPENDQAFLPVQAQMTALKGKFEAYVRNKTFFPVDKVFSAMVYNYDVISSGAAYAVQTQLFYEKMRSLTEEFANYAGLAGVPVGDPTRTVLVVPGERDIEQQQWPDPATKEGEEPKLLTECKSDKDCGNGFTCNDNKKCFAKVPVASYEFVVNATPPGLVEISDPNNPTAEIKKEWQMVVKTDKKDAQAEQVATTEVLTFDFSTAFEAQTKRANALMVRRIATIALELHALSKTLNFAPTGELLSKCAKRESCRIDKKE
jgi:hypothetical protein